MPKKKFRSAEEAKRARELDASWAALKSSHTSPNFSSKNRSAVAATKPKQPVTTTSPLIAMRLEASRVKPEQRAQQQHSNELDLTVNAKLRPELAYSGDMLERELSARERTKLYKNRIAPAYNKGGEQLLTESEAIAMTRGELRRRS
jgi:hypothetical protein